MGVAGWFPGWPGWASLTGPFPQEGSGEGESPRQSQEAGASVWPLLGQVPFRHCPLGLCFSCL